MSTNAEPPTSSMQKLGALNSLQDPARTRLCGGEFVENWWVSFLLRISLLLPFLARCHSCDRRLHTTATLPLQSLVSLLPRFPPLPRWRYLHVESVSFQTHSKLRHHCRAVAVPADIYICGATFPGSIL
jgi:hypothetical protein